MTRPSNAFGARKASALRELAAAVPEIEALAETEPVDALTTVMAFSTVSITIAQRENDVMAYPACQPDIATHPLAAELGDLLAQAISEPLLQPQIHGHFDPAKWLDTHGFAQLVIRLVEAGATPSAIMQATHIAGRALTTLRDMATTLGRSHFRVICSRDIGFVQRNQVYLLPVAQWTLATHLCGQPERALVMTRRRQALDIYAAVAKALLEPPISAAIDEGRPLRRVLADHLDIKTAHLARLRGVRTFAEALGAATDHQSKIDALRLHEVPLHEWPEGRQWEADIFDSRAIHALLRPDYISAASGGEDAIAALSEDLLRPLAGSLAGPVDRTHGYELQWFISSLTPPSHVSGGEAHRLWLRALRHAIIGPRGVKSFGEAIEAWHRRAATLAAVRHENKVDRPGWPALCEPWRSADGEHAIVPLTGAGDLVAEGNALNHCVGGYYPQCRRGDTQIFSLRHADGQRATLELLLSQAPSGRLAIRVGQFRTHSNRTPGAGPQAILQQFLTDLQTGRHPIAHARIAAHRKDMEGSGDHAYRNAPLPLDHARMAWPLYRVLLPRGVPDSFDEWCVTSGLTEAFGTILGAVTRRDQQVQTKGSQQEALP
ncbi:PcfJ domain-containing protein [Sphingomonas sp. H39-1-10]|uniref:PcfJ domain-containing protein n=1 Tax=Sphingomonas pollutisoli TaxID=3030829 RepID=UPI0023B96ED3|nr:PcfJ domain-containing protein [Sphingomonas pollutisoli]MDF0490434.1 PcfJ domain-containing protein [Sphingomonas pollutisoli]